MTELPEQIYAHDGGDRVVYIRSDLIASEHASNETGNLGKGLPNDPESVPENENIQPLSLPGTSWRSIDTAPEDQHVILCTSGGHVGEAIMLIDEDTGQQKWAWALGPLHPNHIPYGWQPLPDALNAPVASDLRPDGFDGPTGAE